MPPQPPFARAWARRQEWVMTNPSSTAIEASPTHPELTASDAERIATAVEAELALSTRQTYDISWRQWERWCSGRGLHPLPAAPEALAVFLTEKATSGLTFGTLDGYCSGIAHATTGRASRTRPRQWSCAGSGVDCVGSWASHPDSRRTRLP